jgi:hypothetical protein
MTKTFASVYAFEIFFCRPLLSQYLPGEQHDQARGQRHRRNHNQAGIYLKRLPHESSNNTIKHSFMYVHNCTYNPTIFTLLINLSPCTEFAISKGMSHENWIEYCNENLSYSFHLTFFFLNLVKYPFYFKR